MVMDQTEVSKQVKVKIPKEILQRDDADDIISELKADIGDFIVASILDYVGEGRSPVTGDKFTRLSKVYADGQKKGDRLPNLDLTGDMLRSLESWLDDKGNIVVGIRDDSEAPKAYNHNTGDTLPKRQFIPNSRQNFDDAIQSGIDRIIKEYADKDN